eukprot:gene6742-9237_t
MSQGRILCCLCGSSIEPNSAAMCIDCLRSQVSIVDDFETTTEIVQCKKCDRWQTKQDTWVHHEMESSGLLGACLKKIIGFQKPDTKVVDAKWIWTEPHCKRMKISVNIERAVMDDKIKLQQNLVIEYVIKNKQCLECIREATDHTWGALIQVRQHVNHKKSFYLLESQLIEAGLYNLMVNVEIAREGLDLYFKSKNQADRVVEFISSHMIVKSKQSKKLVSRNLQSNTSKHEYTTHMEVAPICRGDLVIIGKEYTGSTELMLVSKISSTIQLINPINMAKVEVSSSKYFSRPFTSVITNNQLIQYVVLDIHISNNHENISNKSLIKENGGVFAEVVVARETDLGENDDSYTTYTHLGHLLQPGDTVLGYDVAHSVMDESHVNKLGFDLPDVILVRKSYPESSKAKKSRKKNSANLPPWMNIVEGKKGDKDNEADDKLQLMKQISDEDAMEIEESDLLNQIQLNDEEGHLFGFQPNLSEGFGLDLSENIKNNSIASTIAIENN